MKKFRKLLALVMAVCMVCMVGTVAFAGEPIIDPTEIPESIPVTFVEKDGTRTPSALPAEYFLAMSRNESAQPFSIPPPDYASTRITDIKTVIYTQENINRTAKTAVNFLVSYLWARYGGKLIDKVVGIGISEAILKSNIADAMIDTAIGSVSDFIDLNPLTTESYLYKAWSDYYDCYLVYQTHTYYTDSSKTQVAGIDYWEISRDYAVGLE